MSGNASASACTTTANVGVINKDATRCRAATYASIVQVRRLDRWPGPRLTCAPLCCAQKLHECQRCHTPSASVNSAVIISFSSETARMMLTSLVQGEMHMLRIPESKQPRNCTSLNCDMFHVNNSVARYRLPDCRRHPCTRTALRSSQAHSAYDASNAAANMRSFAKTESCSARAATSYTSALRQDHDTLC